MHLPGSARTGMFKVEDKHVGRIRRSARRKMDGTSTGDWKRITSTGNNRAWHISDAGTPTSRFSVHLNQPASCVARLYCFCFPSVWSFNGNRVRLNTRGHRTANCDLNARNVPIRTRFLGKRIKTRSGDTSRPFSRLFSWSCYTLAGMYSSCTRTSFSGVFTTAS